MKKRHQQKLVVLSMALLIGLNVPIVLLFDSSQSLLGFPIVYIYIFSVWSFSVLLTFFIIKRYDE